MALFSKFGGLKRRDPEMMSSKEMLRDGIVAQKGVLDTGEHLSLSDADLAKRKNIWFKKGVFAPYVGQHLLFGRQSVDYREGTEREVLAELEEALSQNDKELMGYLLRIDKARKESKVERDSVKKEAVKTAKQPTEAAN